MKKFSLILLLTATTSSMAQGTYATSDSTAISKQTATDSIHDYDAIKLGEVTVKAVQQYVTSDAVVYVPTKADKDNAQSAVDLLRMSAIPQIKISPVDDKVTDNFEEEVSIFINYMAGSKEDLTGLNTSDVKKIEYLTSPTDPRFRGAKSVINIIVSRYEYGGYTKLSSTLRTLNGISGDVDVYSKFCYKDTTKKWNTEE